MIEEYQQRVHELLKTHIEELGDKSPLRDACEYALAGGKHFRPSLVLMMADAVGKGYDVSPAALCVEYLHVSSLIADDLPCMDDDDERRGKSSTHIAYGEDTALLASFSLIAAAYEQIGRNSHLLPEGEKAGIKALECVAANTGIRGLTGGQYFDIHPGKKPLFETLAMKTATLFEVSLVLGWLFGGGDLRQLAMVKKVAGHLGLVFQMLDDLGDVDQDEESANSALTLGFGPFMARLNQEISALRQATKALGIDGGSLHALIDRFDAQAQEAARGMHVNG